MMNFLFCLQIFKDCYSISFIVHFSVKRILCGSANNTLNYYII